VNRVIALLFIFSYFFTPTLFAHDHQHQQVDDSSEIRKTFGEFVFVTMGNDMAQFSIEKHNKSNQLELLESAGDVSIMRIPASFINEASHIAHETFKRCGGFMLHKNLKEAQQEMGAGASRDFAKNMPFSDYLINQEAMVSNMITQVQESNIARIIKKLSSYKNRYYQSATGVESQEWLFSYWQGLGKNRADFSVKRWKHSDWKQDSIVATLKGRTDDIIVVGGHADSVAGWWRREKASAPGADDNASGIATTTEIMRILLESGYKPEKTVMFMGYAAEEVGLLGSKEIAKSFKNDNKNVVGVLQLDMTNFNGSEWDIVLMNDFTNENQNKFIGRLIDKYLPGVSWGYDKCGYGCSDHASWTSQGFPASMPFEAKKSQSNRQIHTSRDTISQSGDNAQHAQKFAKMGVAFVIELDR
jgi:leucyl aminopeptidase